MSNTRRLWVDCDKSWGGGKWAPMGDPSSTISTVRRAVDTVRRAVDTVVPLYDGKPGLMLILLQQTDGTNLVVSDVSFGYQR